MTLPVCPFGDKRRVNVREYVHKEVLLQDKLVGSVKCKILYRQKDLFQVAEGFLRISCVSSDSGIATFPPGSLSQIVLPLFIL